MGWFRRPENRLAVSTLLREWEVRNVLARARDFARIGVAILPLLFLADLTVLAPEHYQAYMLPRLAVVAVVLVNTVLIEWAVRRSDKPERWQRRVGLVGLLVPTVAVQVCYAYFLILPFPQYRLATVVANVLVTIFCTVALQRFWRAQYAFNLFGLLLNVFLTLVRPEYSLDLMVLSIVVIVSAISAFVYRREYFGFMILRYQSLCAFLPSPIARFVVIAREGDAVTEAFAAKQRFAVILCADWRNFQSLATTRSPEFISTAFERFYDLVLEHLEMVSPDGGYFVDWNADELFVIFIGQPGDEARTTSQALAFAFDLSTTLFEQARERCGFDLLYDIGMASGHGLIGVMGPKSRKKTTVAAAAAGVAKRLETEAKLARTTWAVASPYPTLALTAELQASTADVPGFAAAPFRSVVATSKDIADQTCYLWRLPAVAANEESGAA